MRLRVCYDAAMFKFIKEVLYSCDYGSAYFHRLELNLPRLCAGGKATSTAEARSKSYLYLAEYLEEEARMMRAISRGIRKKYSKKYFFS